jgi:PAS domain-containing protein
VTWYDSRLAVRLHRFRPWLGVKRRYSGGKVMSQDLATQAIDYKAVFKSFPGSAFLMSPTFEILDVSDEVRETIGRDPRDLVGLNFFDAFPANPRAREATGPRALLDALAQAVRTGDRVVRSLNQYDVEDPGRPGVFEERFWHGVATPIPGDDGRTAVIVLWGHDTTPIVRQFRAQAAALG